MKFQNLVTILFRSERIISIQSLLLTRRSRYVTDAEAAAKAAAAAQQQAREVGDEPPPLAPFPSLVGKSVISAFRTARGFFFHCQRKINAISREQFLKRPYTFKAKHILISNLNMKSEVSNFNV